MGANGAFPSPIYFSLENMESFYRPGLAEMATVLFEITQSAATGMVRYTWWLPSCFRKCTYDLFRLILQLWFGRL